MATQNQYDTTHPTVFDVASENHSNIALVYGDTSKDTYSAIAFQVIRSVRRYERVEGLVNLTDGETKEWGYVGENGFSRTTTDPGSDVFRIDSGRDATIMEYGFAIPQDGVWVGVQTGDSDTVSGFKDGDTRERGLSASDLSQHAGVLSDHTYVEAPDVTLEDAMPTTVLSPRRDQGLFRIDSREDGPNHFYFAFDNQSGASVDIDITGVGMSYDVRPIEDENVAREMVSGRADRVQTYGGFGNTNPNLPSSWYDYVVEIGPGELTPGVSQ